MQSGRIVVETGSACTGIGCCEVNIVLGYPSYNIQIHRLNGAAYALPAAVYLVDRGFSYSADMTIYDNYPEALPATLGWEAYHILSFDNNSVCQNVQSNTIIRVHCYCDDGHQGNPYILGGCQGSIIHVLHEYADLLTLVLNQ